MQIGAETAKQPKLVGGSDGRGWVEAIEKAPMRTMPPGAAALVVEYFRENARVTQAAADVHLLMAEHSLLQTPMDLRTVANGISAARNLLKALAAPRA